MGFLENLEARGESVESLTAAREARRALAEYWLELSDGEAEREFSGEMGRIHLQMAVAGVRAGMVSGADEALREKVLEAAGDMPSAGAMLAAMLMFFPHQLPRLWEVERTPEWLTSAYLGFSLYLPRVYRQRDDPDRAVDYLRGHLRRLREIVSSDAPAALRGKILDAAAGMKVTPAYFSRRNLREVMRDRAWLLEAWLTARGHRLDHSFSRRVGGERIRVGVVALGVGAETETFAALPLYRYLDRGKFEVILIVCKWGESEMDRFCRGLADRTVLLGGDLAGQVAAIRALDLDVALVTTNLTAATNQIAILAAHRLGRVQIAAVNSCVTTGFRNIDAHLSGTLVEGANAAEDYTEKLIQLKGAGHCYDFGTERLGPPEERVGRREFGVGEEEVVFVSGANAYKIVPELEEAWAKILARTPGSRLVLHPDNPNWMAKFPFAAWIERMNATLAAHGAGADRVALLERAPGRQEVLRRMMAGDVYLDSFPFSGATTILDGLVCGLVPVTMEGGNFRSKLGEGMMRELGVPECIARDAGEYVEMAVRLGMEGGFREAIKKKISGALKGGPQFLDGRSYGLGVGEALLEMTNDK